VWHYMVVEKIGDVVRKKKRMHMVESRNNMIHSQCYNSLYSRDDLTPSRRHPLTGVQPLPLRVLSSMPFLSIVEKLLLHVSEI
jgi:hypothetical protein